MTDKEQTIIKLANAGKPSIEIARIVGYQLKTVQNITAKLRQQGLIHTKRLKANLKDPMGDFVADFAELPVEVQEWLEAQAVGGLTVAQVALMCAKDAFVEERKVKFTQPLRSVA